MVRSQIYGYTAIQAERPTVVAAAYCKLVSIINVELHLLYCFKHKRHTPIPLIAEISATLPLKPKKKRKLVKLLDVALPSLPVSTAAPSIMPVTSVPPPPPLAAGE